jgi:hypothetical protein
MYFCGEDGVYVDMWHVKLLTDLDTLIPGVSEERSFFIVKVQLFKMKTLRSSETSGSTNPAKHHISEDLNLQNRSIVAECFYNKSV